MPGMKAKFSVATMAVLMISGLGAIDAPSACDSWLKQFYGKLPYVEYTLVDRAARCLEGNTGGGRVGLKWPWLPTRAARPSTQTFFGVWNWDCAFMALAMAKWDPELAREQVRMFMRLQHEDGMYPDCWKAEPGQEGIFDGASKPPVMAWAAWTAERTAHDQKFLETAYASLKRNVGWWLAKRRRAGDVLLHYDGDSPDEKTRQKYAGWESGMDNSPRWDGRPWEIWAIDLNCYMVLTYRVLRDFATTLGLEAERADWIRREREMTAEIEKRLWDNAANCYYDWDFEKGCFSRVLTPMSFLPLYIGTASAERAKEMSVRAKRLSPGWPTVAYDEPTFEPQGYWRGRTWLNTAYFALRGLQWYGYKEFAEEGRKTILGWVAAEPSNINENYDPTTGKPVGAMYFGWSSAFVIKMVLDWDWARDRELPR